MLLAGKVCIVTGASEGIGEAIARTLVLEGGANVVLAARQVDKLARLAQKLNSAVVDGGDKGGAAVGGQEGGVPDERYFISCFRKKYLIFNWAISTLKTEKIDALLFLNKSAFIERSPSCATSPIAPALRR